MRAEFLYRQELEHVLAALMPQNRLACEVALHTGLRISDVLELKPEQLAPQFWVTEKKTGKRKRVNFPADLLERLKRNSGRYWVFPGARDPKKHRTRQVVWWDVKRASRAFRLPQNVAPHSLRKLYAVELLERRKGDLKAVQRALNHSRGSTTMLYCMALELYRTKYGEGGRRDA